MLICSIIFVPHDSAQSEGCVASGQQATLMPMIRRPSASSLNLHMAQSACAATWCSTFQAGSPVTEEEMDSRSHLPSVHDAKTTYNPILADVHTSCFVGRLLT